jgi:hypothetical protein
VNVFAIVLPVAVPTLVCAGAVGRVEASPGRRTKVVVCAPVAASVVLAVILRASRQGFFGYLPEVIRPAGRVFVYAPLVFVAAFLVREMIREIG